MSVFLSQISIYMGKISKHKQNRDILLVNCDHVTDSWSSRSMVFPLSTLPHSSFTAEWHFHLFTKKTKGHLCYSPQTLKTNLKYQTALIKTRYLPWYSNHNLTNQNIMLHKKRQGSKESSQPRYLILWRNKSAGGILNKNALIRQVVSTCWDLTRIMTAQTNRVFLHKSW
jgi:hypothetical protein